ncbi:MAG TPA: hypothetical protein VFR70_06770 [Flavobacterium sp.]|nr:hypothetical protein [Flavobacterium sp.]
MAKLPDQYYFSEILGGNTNAFAVLVDRYKDLVFSLALKMVKNREEAEEARARHFYQGF